MVSVLHVHEPHQLQLYFVVARTVQPFYLLSFELWARKGFSLTFSAVANTILKLHRQMSTFDKLAKSFAG